MYKNIIWDVDGTLFDTYPAMVVAIGRALADYSITADSAWLMQLAKQSIGHCVATLAEVHRLSETQLEVAFESHYREIEQSTQPPFDHVREIALLVSHCGGSNVIVTHRNLDSMVGLLRTHQLTELFKGWITHQDGYPKKPDPAAFKAALTRFDLDPNETMGVGDRDIDTLGAQGAGLFACQFGPKGVQSTPDLLIEDFGQLLTFMQTGFGSSSERGQVRTKTPRLS